MLRHALALLAALLAAPLGAESLRLPAILGEHMVVQTGKPIPVWGWDKPGAKVSAQLAGVSGQALAGADGRFSLSLPALPEGGPYALTVSGSSEKVLGDVLVGELWLGSGQSNMEFTLSRTHDLEKQLPKADRPRLRLFTVERRAAAAPQEDLRGQWKVCTPENAKAFSAVAYHFGARLQERRKVPVGLICAAWGGTPGEDWVPREALAAQPQLERVAKEWESDKAKVQSWAQGLSFDLSLRKLQGLDAKGNTRAIKLDAAHWSHSEAAGSTATAKVDKVARYQGVVPTGGWAGASVSLDGAQDFSGLQSIVFDAKGKGEIRLALGQPSITDWDFHGSDLLVLSDKWTQYSVALGSVKQGGWGQPKPFTPAAIDRLGFNFQVPYWPDLPAVAYNGMVAPLTPLPIRGVLWYQGESNEGRAGDYELLLRTLITSWRAAFGQADMPFLIAQLPLYRQPCSKPCESGWARLRDAQRRTALMEAVAMAVTLDLGEAGDVHPRNKTEVGRRLAALLSGVYGRIARQETLPVKARVSGDQVLVSFASYGRGLRLSRSAADGFELAGADGIFCAARGSLEGLTVHLQAQGVAQPRKLRYAWADNPAFSLVGDDGVPLTPFEMEVEP